MEENIWVSGLTKSCMALESINGLTAKCTLVSMWMIKRKVLVYIYFLMEGDMKVGGSMANSMESVPFILLIVRMLKS